MGLNEVDVRRILWTAAQGFVAGWTLAAAGLGPINNMSEAKAVLPGLIVAGIAAAVSAVKNLVLADGSSLK